MEDFNITYLIENNPITEFSNKLFESKLVEQIQNEFNSSHAKIFLSSFYCYLKYDTNKDFVIDLNNVWEWIGFSQKIRAKELLEKYFEIEKDYKILFLINKRDFIGHNGGLNKQNIMLTVNTFKKLCLKASTKKSHQLHEYFINLEQIIFNIIKEERKDLHKQLIETEKQKENERVKILLNTYGNSGPLVYIIKVKTFETGEYVIKIGESRYGIKARYNEHKKNYEECVLLDCFQVIHSKDFEQYLHKYPIIRENRYRDLNNHEKENELFLIGNKLTYQMVLDEINRSISSFQMTVDALIKENELLRLKLEKFEKQENTFHPQNNHEFLEKKLDELSIKLSQIENKLEHTSSTEISNFKPTKLTNGFGEQMPHLGPRVQMINPETLQLVKVYECITEVMNEKKEVKRPSINKAIEKNTIYCGYRWMTVERNRDPTIIHNLPPTKAVINKNIGYIAKLNIDKSEIMNVYIDRKTAASMNGYLSSAALDSPVSTGKSSNGFFYKLYENCDNHLKQKFQEKYGEPFLYKNGFGQFNESGELVQSFSSKYECLRTLKISDKTMNKILKNKSLYNGFHYNHLEAKLSVIV